MIGRLLAWLRTAPPSRDEALAPDLAEPDPDGNLGGPDDMPAYARTCGLCGEPVRIPRGATTLRVHVATGQVACRVDDEPDTPPPGRPGMSPPEPVSLTKTTGHVRLITAEQGLAGVVGELINDVSDHSERIDAHSDRIERIEQHRTRTERCDGLCPGDDCRLCARDAQWARTLLDLTDRVTALESAVADLRAHNETLRGNQ